ncbi:MAG: signal peptide protein [Limisphaerales bacterium]|nr:MAG: signal peptide protein [Limisphaerales bacterium]KAG0510406.1 MAG: signal peptide protein [Limisphaerales bacterium]TXT51593.1 MAG: signal peptide protein [Limisphaerales bacterium]
MVCLAVGITSGFAATPSLEAGRKHWAFQPVRAVQLPTVKDATWSRNDVDRFILAALEAKGLKPSPEADRRTLIRRVTFDLIGLPPTPEEVEAFVRDTSPQAWERVVDRLLASPHYGERWGRHWLDLARYADSSGFHNDLDRPHAWRYRDYVIRSFNEDKPYARFIAEQLAGDEVPGASEETLVATGFCRNGPTNDDNMGNNKEQYRLDELDDVISTTSTVFLGLTVGCARCHDHKYDPVTSADYYSLLAVFNGTVKKGVPKESDEKDKAKELVKLQALIETKATVPPTYLLRRGSLQNKGPEVPPAAPLVLVSNPLRFPEPAADAKSSGRRRTLAEWIAAPDNPLTWRVLANRIWQHHFGQGLVATASNFGFNGTRPTHPELLDFLAARLVAEGGRWKPLHKLILMSATYGQEVGGSNQYAVVSVQSGTRPAAERPTEHWTLNTEHSRAAVLDPDNTLLWRANLQRLSAESLRDSILSVSGKLNPQLGGPGIKPRIRADLLTASQRNKWPTLTTEGPAQWRRSVYIYVKRQLLMPMMELFDAPTTTDSCAERTKSVVPTQALVLMNDEFVEDHAGFLAQRAATDVGGDLSKAIERMHQLALARVPTAERLRQATGFVTARESVYEKEAGAKEAPRQRALTDLAHVLFNSSEFITIE